MERTRVGGHYFVTCPDKLRPCGGRQDKTPSEGGGGVRLLKSFFCACTQISTQIFWRLISKCYICAVNQIYRLLCR